MPICAHYAVQIWLIVYVESVIGYTLVCCFCLFGSTVVLICRRDI